MSFKCIECGHIFEEGECKKWIEPHGEKISGCPICRGAYEETVKCAICNGEHLEAELFGGVCKDCIDKKRNDFDYCYDISVDEEKEVTINALLASIFEPMEIEAILVSHIKFNCPNIDCSPFIDEDKSWFGERIVEEVKKYENSKK